MLTKFIFLFFFLVKISITNDELPPNHIRHIIFHEFKRGSSAAQSTHNIDAVYGRAQ